MKGHPLLEEYTELITKIAMAQGLSLAERELLSQRCAKLFRVISDLLFAVAPAVDDIDSLE